MSKAGLAHHYDDPKDALIAPHKFMALTHYYVDRWLPELGERGHVIVTVLRRMGYLDRERDVERGGIEIEQEDLAALCGLKLRTLQREFANEDGQPVNPALHRFVQREKQYHRNGAGRVVREKTVYIVQMRDPLHPNDQAAFQEECDKREKNAENPRSRQDGGNSHSRSRQIGGEARQDDARARQSDTPARQIGGNNNVIPDSYVPKLPPNDASGAPGVSPAAVPGKAQKQDAEDKKPEYGRADDAPWPFDLLADAERAPWLEAAEQELRENFGLPVWLKTKEKAKASIRAQRAANLYLAEGKQASEGTGEE